MGKTAIVLGASGITGSALLEKLTNDKDFDSVKIFTRRTIHSKHPKVKEYLVDLLDLEKHKIEFNGDVVFCCIGTTKKNTPDKTQYKAIDYGIPVNAARLAKENNIKVFIVISALGADANSKIFYNRTKGKMENGVLLQQIEQTYILQPSLIDYVRNERLGEKIGVYIMRIFNFLLFGPLKKYKSITPLEIAEAMIQLTKRKYNFTRIESHQIKEIANNKI